MWVMHEACSMTQYVIVRDARLCILYYSVDIVYTQWKSPRDLALQLKTLMTVVYTEHILIYNLKEL